MKLRNVWLLLAISSILFFACSRKQTAKATPKPTETKGTSTTAQEHPESPATGTTITNEGVQPTQEGGVLETKGKEKTTGTTGSEPSGTIRTNVADAELTDAVRKALKDSGSSIVSSIVVFVQNGVVTLTGNVSSEDEANRIIEVVKSVDGVNDVVSKLTVATP